MAKHGRPTPRVPSAPSPASEAPKPVISAPAPTPVTIATHDRDRFVSEARFEEAHPRALAMYCSDGRFTEAVEDLLRHLGHARLDTLTMPGGPALLNVLAAGFVELDAMTRATSFLVRGHAIDHAVLIAHEGCGYYRHRHGAKPQDAITALQLDDLRVAARAIAVAHSQLTVDLFYARPTGRGVAFERVPI